MNDVGSASLLYCEFSVFGEKFRHRQILLVVFWRHEQKIKQNLEIFSDWRGKKVNFVITFCRRLQNNGVENGLKKVELGTYWKLSDLLIRALKHFLRKLRHVHFTCNVK